jgi:hypothetical protein
MEHARPVRPDLPDLIRQPALEGNNTGVRVQIIYIPRAFLGSPFIRLFHSDFLKVRLSSAALGQLSFATKPFGRRPVPFSPEQGLKCLAAFVESGWAMPLVSSDRPTPLEVHS